MQVVTNKSKLIVRVIEARGLKIGDVSGSSDPFVELRIKDQSHYHKTRIVKNTINPFWNEQFELFPNNPEIDVLLIKIYDFDLITTNDLLGEIEIPVSYYMNKPGGVEEWRHLQKKHGYGRVDTQGDIKLFIQYQGPFTQAPMTTFPVQYPNAQPPQVQVQYPQQQPQQYPQPQYPPQQQYPQQLQYPPQQPQQYPQQQYSSGPNSLLNQPYPPQPYPQVNNQPPPQQYPTQQYPQQAQYPPQQYPQQQPQYAPQQPQYPPQQYPQQQLQYTPQPQQYPPQQQYVYPQSYVVQPQLQTFSAPTTYSLYNPSSPVTFVTVPQTYTRVVYNYPSAYQRTTQFAVPIGISPQLAAKMLQASTVFRTFDTDCSGYLSKKEWKRAMYHLGYAMNKYDAKRLFYMVDKDMSGRISEREFCEFWLSVHPY